MILKPKTARRLLLLGAVLVVAIASAVGFFFVRTWQLERRFEGYRAAGVSALEKDDYAEAINNLGRYLRNKRYENDREALLSYAKAREALEEKDLGHLTQAIGIYERALSLDPTDRETRLKLLKLYNDTGFFQEALDHADRLLPDGPASATKDDVEALRGRITALLGLRPPTGASNAANTAVSESIDRLAELQPDDFAIQALKTGWLGEMSSRQQAVEYARKVAADHPDDPAFQVMVALAEIDPQREILPQVEAVCRVIGLDLATARFLREPSLGGEAATARVISFFDSVGYFRHSLAVAEASVAEEKSTDMLRFAVRRAWSLDAPDKILAMTEGLDPTTAASDVAAFRALAFMRKGNRAPAADIASALAARGQIYQARIWSPLLTALTTDPSATGRTLIEAADESLKQNAREPIIHFFRGQGLAQVDRFSEARDAWRTAAASPASIGWATPLVRVSESLQAEQRWEEALRAAEEANAASPQDLQAQINLVLAEAAMIENGYTLRQSPQEISTRIDNALSQLITDSPAAKRALEESLLPARVILASRAGQSDRAKNLILDYVNSEGTRSRALLERLARLSVSERLGIESQVLDVAENTGGSGPSTDLVRALALARDNDAAAGLAVLQAGRDRTDGEARLRYDVAIAQFKEAIQDAEAASAWASLIDAHPENVELHATAMQSDAAMRDGALAAKIIDRYMTLSGADPARPPVAVRLARARSILVQPTLSARQRDEAIGIVRAVVTEVPTLVAGRRLLINALLREAPEENGQRAFVADLAGATEQMRALIPLVPDPVPVRLQLAAILAERNETAAARDEFLRIASDLSVDIAARETAATGLIALREFAAAIPPLEAVVRERGDTVSDRTLIALARAYEATRSSGRAKAVMDRLAARTLTDPAVIVEVADALAFAGDRAGADSVLARLEPLDVPQPEKLRLRGDFLARHGDREAAAAVYSQMITVSPDEPGGYVALAGLRLTAGDADAATSVLESAPESVRSTSEARLMRQQIELLGKPNAEIDFAKLAEALESSGQFPARAQAVRALAQLDADGRLSDPDSLLAVARRFRTETSVQTIITRLLLDKNPPALRQASLLAAEARSARPGDPEIAEMAARTFAGTQEWEAMLSAAQTWAELSRDVAADLAVAEAHLGARRPNQAVSVLEPLVADASRQLDSPVAVGILSAYTRGLIRQRDDRRALDILEPLLAREPRLRRELWIPFAAEEVTTLVNARAWLERVRSSLSTPDDARAAALAYLTLGERFPEARASLAAESIAIISPQVSADRSPMNLTILGAAQQAAGDTNSAAASYRAALAEDPAAFPALPRIVELLGSNASTAQEAVSIAQAAYDSRSDAERPIGLAVVLARAHTAAGAAATGPAAAEHFRAATALYDQVTKALPNDVEMHAQAAATAEAVGDYAAAVRFYKGALANPPANPQLLAVLQNNAAYAMYRAGVSGDELNAARDMVRTAAGILPEAAILDTLAHLEVATGNRAGGIEAFRRALQRQPDLASAKVGLAAVLAAGSPAEQTEARSLLAGVDPSKLTPVEKDEYDTARRRLGG